MQVAAEQNGSRLTLLNSCKVELREEMSRNYSICFCKKADCQNREEKNEKVDTTALWQVIFINEKR